MLKTLQSRLLAIPAVVLATSPAFAEVPAGVSSAITGMQADAVTVGGLILVALVAVMAFKFIRKAF